MKVISIEDLFEISNDIIDKYTKVFLCDGSENDSYMRIISSYSFEPESFTINDRILKKDILRINEADFDIYCNDLILDQLQRISESEVLL